MCAAIKQAVNLRYLPTPEIIFGVTGGVFYPHPTRGAPAVLHLSEIFLTATISAWQRLLHRE
jgi:hypothetical protein